MKTFFVEKAKKKCIFRKIIINGNKIIINYKLENAKIKKKVKIAKKIKEILVREKSRQIVLERTLKNDNELVNLLHSYNINICNSKWLFKQLTNEIIQETLQDKSKEESEIFICVNEIDSLVEGYIFKFAKEFKRMNIITQHIGKFRKIEETLFNQEGILITVTNNKRKSLAKAELILNIDFPKETLNQFTIYDNAKIITWEDDIKILKKKFNGKIIDDYKFNFENQKEILKYINDNKLENFDERDICQVINFIPNINKKKF